MWRPSKRQWHLHAWLLAILAAVFALVWRAPPYDPFTGLASYLPLHTTLETFSFVIRSWCSAWCGTPTRASAPAIS